jgi:hypothetical protein
MINAHNCCLSAYWGRILVAKVNEIILPILCRSLDCCLSCFMNVLCSSGNCEPNCIEYTSNYLSWESPGIGRFVTFMFIQSTIAFTILLCMDYKIFSRIYFFVCQKSQRTTRVGNQLSSNDAGTASLSNVDSTTVRLPDTLPTNAIQDDDDVNDEASRIRRTSHQRLSQTDVLILDQVEKIYNGKFRAVDQISFGVKRQECFGLLGVNGA